MPTLTAALGNRFTDERVPCHLEKAPARCAHLSKQVPRGTMRLVVGAAVLDRSAVMVSCGFLDDGKGIPAVCKDSIAFP